MNSLLFCPTYLDEAFHTPDDFIRINTLRNMESATLVSRSNTLVFVLKYILKRLKISISNCCNQCYGKVVKRKSLKQGVSTEIRTDSLSTFLKNCSAHTLNLVDKTIEKHNRHYK